MDYYFYDVPKHDIRRPLPTPPPVHQASWPGSLTETNSEGAGRGSEGDKVLAGVGGEVRQITRNKSGRIQVKQSFCTALARRWTRNTYLGGRGRGQGQGERQWGGAQCAAGLGSVWTSGKCTAG